MLMLFPGRVFQAEVFWTPLMTRCGTPQCEISTQAGFFDIVSNG
jgi:hypothetical protein